jgi:SAM-dependent methyltransferase
MGSLLPSPWVYLLSQWAGGFMNARKRAVEEYVPLYDGMRVLDIGCGPAYIIDYLPKCTYVGFDIDEKSIAHAQQKYVGNHTFFCRPFDREQAERVGRCDLVLMLGLLHHLTDDEARTVLDLARDSLDGRGVLLTLDGCYVPGQSVISKCLLDKDRGSFVRDASGYRGLFEGIFPGAEFFVRSDLTWIPYTWMIVKSAR